MTVILDASALLAYLQGEPPWRKYSGSHVSQPSIHDFTSSHAETTAALWTGTKKFGLSLGDRACLSLATVLNLPVFTTDKAWSKAKLPVKVTLIR